MSASDSLDDEEKRAGRVVADLRNKLRAAGYRWQHAGDEAGFKAAAKAYHQAKDRLEAIRATRRRA